MPGISQTIQVHNLAHLRLSCRKSNKVRPDESGTACDEKVHAFELSTAEPNSANLTGKPGQVVAILALRHFGDQCFKVFNL